MFLEYGTYLRNVIGIIAFLAPPLRKDWLHNHPSPGKIFSALRIAGGLAYYPDLMHAKHLGVDCWTYGSVIVYMALEIIEDSEQPTVAMKYTHIFRCIKAKYKDAMHDSQMLFILPTICKSQHMCVCDTDHVAIQCRAPLQCDAAILEKPNAL